MKEKKNILRCVNIIIYMILIGIIISFFIDKNIIIGKGKQIIKEMTQSELESSLDNTIKQLNANQELYANNVQAYKKQIAEAITSQGVSTSENDTGAVMAANIGKILTAKTTATATAAQILDGRTAWVNGVQITGTMVNRGELTGTLNAGESFAVPPGYTSGGTITANSLASQTSATATAGDIAKGATAWVNGNKITGTMNAWSGLELVQNIIWTDDKVASKTYTLDLSAGTYYIFGVHTYTYDSIDPSLMKMSRKDNSTWTYSNCEVISNEEGCPTIIYLANDATVTMTVAGHKDNSSFESHIYFSVLKLV